MQTTKEATRARDQQTDVIKNYMTLDHKSSGGLTSADSYSPKKTSAAYKKAKKEQLGKYLNRASQIIRSSHQSSLRSSHGSTSRERSICEVSYDKSDVITPFKKVAVFLDNTSMSIRHLNKKHIQTLRSSFLRNSLEVPSVSYLTRKKFKESEPQLKSFVSDNLMPNGRKSGIVTSPLNAKNQYNPRNSVNIPESKLTDMDSGLTDAGELKDFIEVEDYCRRTTAANSRASVFQSTPKKASHKRKTAKHNVFTKLQSAVKNKNVIATRNQKSKFSKKGSSFIKTFAITILKDDKIVFN